jgi:hypothetical protein
MQVFWRTLHTKHDERRQPPTQPTLAKRLPPGRPNRRRAPSLWSAMEYRVCNKGKRQAADLVDVVWG